MRLLVFAACEKVIFNADGGAVSLIQILETINFAIPATEQIDDRVLVPVAWSVFTLWDREDPKDETLYEQRVALLNPQGVFVFHGLTPFQFVNPVHRIVTQFANFPAQRGIYSVELSVRKHGSDADWAKQATYPIRVIHSPQVEIPADGLTVLLPDSEPSKPLATGN